MHFPRDEPVEAAVRLDDQRASLVDVARESTVDHAFLGPPHDGAPEARVPQPAPLIADPSAVALPQPRGDVGQRSKQSRHQRASFDFPAELALDGGGAIGDVRRVRRW